METAVYSNSTQHTRHISSHMPVSPQQSQMTSGRELDEKSPDTGRLHRTHAGCATLAATAKELARQLEASLPGI